MDLATFRDWEIFWERYLTVATRSSLYAKTCESMRETENGPVCHVLYTLDRVNITVNEGLPVLLSESVKRRIMPNSLQHVFATFLMHFSEIHKMPLPSPACEDDHAVFTRVANAALPTYLEAAGITPMHLVLVTEDPTPDSPRFSAN